MKFNKKFRGLMFVVALVVVHVSNCAIAASCSDSDNLLAGPSGGEQWAIYTGYDLSSDYQSVLQKCSEVGSVECNGTYQSVSLTACAALSSKVLGLPQNGGCCITPEAQDWIAGGGGDGSGSVNGEGIDTSKGITLQCPETQSQSSCAMHFNSPTYTNLFGETGGAIECKYLGFSGDGWCWVNKAGAELYHNSLCFGTDYIYVYGKDMIKGGAYLYKGAALSHQSISDYYYYLEREGKCVCGDGYYGNSYVRSDYTSSPCTKCPGGAGKTGTSSKPLNGDNRPASVCYITCTADSDCRGSNGYYKGNSCYYQ